MNSLSKLIYLFTLIVFVFAFGAITKVRAASTPIKDATSGEKMAVDSAEISKKKVAQKKALDEKNLELLSKIATLTDELNSMKKITINTDKKLDKLFSLMERNNITTHDLISPVVTTPGVEGKKILVWLQDYIGKFKNYDFSPFFLTNLAFTVIFCLFFSIKINNKILKSLTLVINEKLTKTEFNIVENVKKFIPNVNLPNNDLKEYIIDFDKIIIGEINKLSANIDTLVDKINDFTSRNLPETDLQTSISPNKALSEMNDLNERKIESFLIETFNNNSWEVFIATLAKYGFAYESAMKTDSLSRQGATWKIQKSDSITNILVWYKKNPPIAYLMSKRDNDKKVELSSLYGDMVFENNHKYSKLAMFSEAKDKFGNTIYKWVNDGELITENE